MPFAKILTSKAFSLPAKCASDVAVESQLDSFLTSLYNTKPCAEFKFIDSCHTPWHEQLFYQQQETLLAKYCELASTWQLSDAHKKIIAFKKKYFKSQHPFGTEKDKRFYIELKQLFELVCYLLIETEKTDNKKAHKELAYLAGQVTECPTGVMGALQTVQYNLTTPATPAHWLERCRATLIEKQAQRAFQRFSTRWKLRDPDANPDKYHAEYLATFSNIANQYGFHTEQVNTQKTLLPQKRVSISLSPRIAERLIRDLEREYNENTCIQSVVTTLCELLSPYQDTEKKQVNLNTAQTAYIDSLLTPFYSAAALSHHDVYTCIEETEGETRTTLNPKLLKNLKEPVRDMLIHQAFLHDWIAEKREAVISALDFGSATMKAHQKRLKIITNQEDTPRPTKNLLVFQQAAYALTAHLAEQGQFRKGCKWLLSFLGLDFLAHSVIESRLIALRAEVITERGDSEEIAPATYEQHRETIEQAVRAQQQLNTALTVLSAVDKFQRGSQLKKIQTLRDHLTKEPLFSHSAFLDEQSLSLLLELDEQFFNTEHLCLLLNHLNKDSLAAEIKWLNQYLQDSSDSEQAIHRLTTLLSQGLTFASAQNMLCLPNELRRNFALIKEVRESGLGREATATYQDWWTKHGTEDSEQRLQHFLRFFQLAETHTSVETTPTDAMSVNP